MRKKRAPKAKNDVQLYRQLEARTKKTAGGCWEWRGCLSSNGYGHIRRDGNSTKLVHRIMYGLVHGSVPEGMNVLHKCDNRPCINPDHLEAGTQQKNLQDAWKRTRKGVRVECVETGQVFEKVRDAATWAGDNPGNIVYSCKFPHRTVKGYHFRYAA